MDRNFLNPLNKFDQLKITGLIFFQDSIKIEKSCKNFFMQFKAAGLFYKSLLRLPSNEIASTIIASVFVALADGASKSLK